MAYIGKVIALLGAFLTMIRPLMAIIGKTMSDWWYLIGIIIIIVGAIIHLLEK